MKFPFKLGKFGKKKASAEDGEEDAGIGDDDGLDEGDEDDDGGGGKRLLAKLGANKKLLIIGGVSLLLLLGGGGAAWYLFSGDDTGKVAGRGETAARKGEQQAAIKSRAEAGSPSVEMALPAKGGGTGGAAGGGLNAIAASSLRGPEAGIMIAATTSTAFRTLSPPPPARPLAPIAAALVEKGPNGPLPVIGDKGEMPWRVYAAPPPAAAALKGKGLVAVVVTGLGLSTAVTKAAIAMLPGAVTLAFDPYAQNLAEWMAQAREKGHELLIILPMEPNDFPASDPGPYGLLTANKPAENRRRLTIVLSRMEGYIGVITGMGGRFTPMAASVRPIVKELKVRGLMIIDASATPKSVVSKIADELKVPRAVGDLIVADNLSRKNTGRELVSIEDVIRRKSVALVVMPPTPAALESLSVWAAGLAAKKLALVPASALADKQVVK
ncbi:MAG TPA: divergent polysaccharide deacetylase family protein [Alphaproteobacteria bacterium]|nr:divergent polysaccharide deacetylase family protein [Alphaproteobacteria bacterium]